MRKLRVDSRKLKAKSAEPHSQDWLCHERSGMNDWVGGYTPHPMHECQNKGDIKWAICKCMKRKSGDFLGETKSAFPSTALGMNHNGNCWYTPGGFRKSGKQRSYGIRKMKECASD